MTLHASRQVFDLPEPKPIEATEHKAYQQICPCCGTQTVADFPEGVTAPAQYGDRLKSMVLYFSGHQLLPVKRLKDALLCLHGVAMSQATIQSILRDFAEDWKPAYDFIGDQIATGVRVKHFDETGMRVAGKLGWVHVGCTELLTHLRLGESRGDIMRGVTGIAVHDHWKSYFTRWPATKHGICVAHLLRELQALVDHGNESWAQKMIECLAEAIKAAKDGTPPDHRIAELEESYDALVAEGIRDHELRTPLPSKRKGRRKRRLGHNLAIRLCDFRRETLRFLHDPDVPPTNNQAERDLRVPEGQAENLRWLPHRSRSA